MWDLTEEKKHRRKYGRLGLCELHDINVVLFAHKKAQKLFPRGRPLSIQTRVLGMQGPRRGRKRKFEVFDNTG